MSLLYTNNRETDLVNMIAAEVSLGSRVTCRVAFFPGRKARAVANGVWLGARGLHERNQADGTLHL